MKKYKYPFKNNMFVKISLVVIIDISILFLIFNLLSYTPQILSYFFFAAQKIIDSLKPVFWGLILAYIISPLVNIVNDRFIVRISPINDESPVRQEKLMRRQRILSTLLTYIMLLVIFFAVFYGFTAMLIGRLQVFTLSELLTQISGYINEMSDAFREWSSSFAGGIFSEIYAHFSSELFLDYDSILAAAREWLSAALNFILALTISVYILADSHRFKRAWRKFLHIVFSQKTNALITQTILQINDVLSKFIKGAAVDGIIVAAISSAVLSVAGLDFAVFFGIFIGIANVIPYFGPLLSAIPVCITAYFSDGWLYALFIAALLFIIQQTDSDLIYPKVVGNTIGLHPLYVFLAVTFGSYYAGIPGMIAAVPLAGILKIFILQSIHIILEKRDSK